MNVEGGTIGRRAFIGKTASFLLGTWLGLDTLSTAMAFGFRKTPPLAKSVISLIIDDMGYSLSRTEQFLNLEIPLTFSILPRLPRSEKVALEIHAQGHEIMLHQPMQPYNADLDPGPGALYVGDGTKKITRIVEENISSLPFISGVNNHMGSRFTECQREMGAVLRVIKKRGLHFIDSLTTSHSKAYTTAKSLHMPAAQRNIFLDNLPHESAILFQLNKLKKHALKYGRAIGIGHPHPETARAIFRFRKDLGDSGPALVYISQVIRV